MDEKCQLLSLGWEAGLFGSIFDCFLSLIGQTVCLDLKNACLDLIQ
jgi:hypothetical protein